MMGGHVRTGTIAAAIAAATLLLVTGCASEHDNPFEGKMLYVDPDSSAANAAASESDATSRAAFERLASTPSAIWLLPEEHPTASIASYVAGVQADAVSKGQLTTYVVYGIPSRDCGNFSAGGTTSADYHDWIVGIAEGIGTTKTTLILEPDALALSPECGTEAATATFLNDAIGALSASNAAIYLDGGHSNWLPAEQMAQLLEAAGVDRVRGFATNVSNYNATAAEHEYGERLSALVGGAHYVVDTSRNGNGSNGEWCNPAGRALGDTPSGVSGAGAQDANLWIKTPGESDGNCNGGPSAGQWWPESALALVRGN